MDCSNNRDMKFNLYQELREHLLAGFIYSTIKCLNCNEIWKTKAKYANNLEDIRKVLS